MKIKILNMACGHCRLKIESELKSAGFTKIEFDMLNDIVDVDGNNLTKFDAYKAIEKAGYMVDESYRDIDSEIVFKISNLNSEEDVTELKEFLQSQNVDNLEINLDNRQLKVVKTEKEIFEIKELIEILGYEADLLD